MITWDTLVTERNTWVAKNFPNPSIPDPGESILGCIEELGELAHHWLKKAQGIRGTDEEHDAEMKDAVGDLTVYLLGVMNAKGCRPRGKPIMSLQSPHDCIFHLSRCIGKLSQTHHPQDQVTSIVYILGRFCSQMGWNYEKIVMDTWNHVKQRDWTKHPEDGGDSQRG